MSFANSYIANTRVENRYLSATLPPEPRKGSVVLDKDGIAWQRGDESWSKPNSVSWSATRWLVLLAEHGPVRLLHDAPADEPECAEVGTRWTIGEPSIGSFVRDCEGDAWVRRQDGRWFHDGLIYRWSDLLKEYGPVIVLDRNGVSV
jgi:hypothetical protein